MSLLLKAIPESQTIPLKITQNSLAFSLPLQNSKVKEDFARSAAASLFLTTHILNRLPTPVFRKPVTTTLAPGRNSAGKFGLWPQHRGGEFTWRPRVAERHGPLGLFDDLKGKHGFGLGRGSTLYENTRNPSAGMEQFEKFTMLKRDEFIKKLPRSALSHLLGKSGHGFRGVQDQIRFARAAEITGTIADFEMGIDTEAQIMRPSQTSPFPSFTPDAPGIHIRPENPVTGHLQTIYTTRESAGIKKLRVTLEDADIVYGSKLRPGYMATFVLDQGDVQQSPLFKPAAQVLGEPRVMKLGIIFARGQDSDHLYTVHNIHGKYPSDPALQILSTRDPSFIRKTINFTAEDQIAFRTFNKKTIVANISSPAKDIPEVTSLVRQFTARKILGAGLKFGGAALTAYFLYHALADDGKALKADPKKPGKMIPYTNLGVGGNCLYFGASMLGAGLAGSLGGSIGGTLGSATRAWKLPIIGAVTENVALTVAGNFAGGSLGGLAADAVSKRAGINSRDKDIALLKEFES